MLVFASAWTSSSFSVSSSSSSSSSGCISASTILFQWFLLLSFIPSVLAEPRNFTIDDTFGDELSGAQVVYGGHGVSWRALSREHMCNGCQVNPAPAYMKYETWHDATVDDGNGPASIEFKFNGTALYIFCALAGAIGNGVTTQSHLSLTIDGTTVDNFDWDETFGPPFLYQVPVLSADGLDSTREHTATVLSVPSAGPNGMTSSIVLFDYAVYTTDPKAPQQQTVASPKDSSGDSSNLKLGLGLGLGLGILAASVLVLSVYLFTRCVKRNREDHSERPAPGVVEAGHARQHNRTGSSTTIDIPEPNAPSGWGRSTLSSEAQFVIPGRGRVRRDKSKQEEGRLVPYPPPPPPPQYTGSPRR